MTKRDNSGKPLTPTVVVWAGLVVGVIGLIMTLLGIGGVAPVRLVVPGVNLDVQTSSVAITVLIVGFATALIPLVMAMWVDVQRRNSNQQDDAQVDPSYVSAVFRHAPGGSSEVPTPPKGPDSGQS